MTNKKNIRKPFGGAERLDLEFKRATDKVPSSFFDTVCAFLNMDGGQIVLGVEDDGTVSGIDPDAIARIKADIANLSNNPQKLDPPHLLFPHEEQVGDKWCIKVLVPASSQVHQTGGHVFLRSEDGDYRIKGVNRLAGLMNRKLSFFTEQRVYPYLGLDDLDPALFKKARKLMLGRQPQHPWANLPPEELLKVAGFVRQDYAPGAGKPVFEDGDMFTVIVPLAAKGGAESGAESLADRTIRLMADGPKLKSEIARELGRKSVTGQVNRVVNSLLSSELIERTIPDKPTSRLQKYRLTDKGRAMIEQSRR